MTCPRHVPQVVELSKAVYLVLDEAGPEGPAHAPPAASSAVVAVALAAVQPPSRPPTARMAEATLSGVNLAAPALAGSAGSVQCKLARDSCVEDVQVDAGVSSSSLPVLPTDPCALLPPRIAERRAHRTTGAGAKLEQKEAVLCSAPPPQPSIQDVRQLLEQQCTTNT